jgi:hypothetical protein
MVKSVQKCCGQAAWLIEEFVNVKVGQLNFE